MGYINALPGLIEQRMQAGDARAAAHYANFAHQVRADSLLSSLVTHDTLRMIDELARLTPHAVLDPADRALVHTISPSKVPHLLTSR